MKNNDSGGKMKRIAAVMALVMTVGTIASCSKNASVNESASIVDTSSEVVTDTTYEETTEVVHESHYTFKAHVYSGVFDGIMGQDMREGYDNLVDAVLAGETSFKCKDEYTYGWVIGQYPYRLFPVIAEYIYPDYYADGMGHFKYKIPYEEFKVKLQEFEDIVTGILNECLEDDYSDVEKALALYVYFSDNYEYNFDMSDKLMSEGDDPNISGYNLLTEGSNICQGISIAYSYLLMQAGVDASTVMGMRDYDGAHHQWSIVKINGAYYHIDPTYVIGDRGSLEFFMMTDEQRYNADRYYKDSFVYATNYYQDHPYGDYSATDDSYKELWDCYFVSMDTAGNKIFGMNLNDEELEFEYKD